MKKRIVATLAAVLLLCSTISCMAAENASHYFDGYILGLSALGNCKMAVSFSVLGTDEMDQIGAYSILVEEEIGDDVWFPTFTAYGDDDPDTFYSYDIATHTGSFTFYGVPDVKYRATMVSYAKNSEGEEYSREFTCTGRKCK